MSDLKFPILQTHTFTARVGHGTCFRSNL